MIQIKKFDQKKSHKPNSVFTANYPPNQNYDDHSGSSSDPDSRDGVFVPEPQINYYKSAPKKKKKNNRNLNYHPLIIQNIFTNHHPLIIERNAIDHLIIQNIMEEILHDLHDNHLDHHHGDHHENLQDNIHQEEIKYVIHQKNHMILMIFLQYHHDFLLVIIVIINHGIDQIHVLLKNKIKGEIVHILQHHILIVNHILLIHHIHGVLVNLFVQKML